MSVALDGPAKQIGNELSTGARLYFDELNRQGGIHNSDIKLIVLDDGYEPARTVDNTKLLIENEKVDALFTFMGTPTSWAIKSLLEHSKIPFITPFTGAEFLRSPDTFHTFNVRASYNQEAAEQIHFLVNEKNKKHIALLIQADEFGLTLEKSLLKALQAHQLQPVTISRFRRNTQDINKALRRITNSGATAVAMVGTYAPLAEFINDAQASNLDFEYTTVSFASSQALYQRIAPSAKVMTTEVIPDPLTCEHALCNAFRQQAQTQKLSISRLMFEGYINAFITSQALQLCTLPFERSCLIEKLEHVKIHDETITELFNRQAENNYVVFRSYNQ
ncbi:Extracellular ligand-binding receptor [Pseudoalteromonas luteoviolacea B = ATCC 29581]|nr:Extracellular ligand-binding receptor [Pseudoalteromonas luteoviolacea B = ATCC 29581]